MWTHSLILSYWEDLLDSTSTYPSRVYSLATASHSIPPGEITEVGKNLKCLSLSFQLLPFPCLVPFDVSVGSSTSSSLLYQELVYYRFSYTSTGLTLVLDIDYGSVICYTSDTLQNPNRQHGYTARVEASYYNDSYIDPSVFQSAVGGYLYIGIEGSANVSNNTFSLNSTTGDYSTKGKNKPAAKQYTILHFYTVPDPPDGIRSLSITTTSTEIAWDIPVAAINTPISGIDHYELMVYEDRFNLPTIFANTTETSYLFTGLEEYVNYSCEVAAVNTVGQGLYSTAFIILTMQAGITFSI